MGGVNLNYENLGAIDCIEIFDAKKKDKKLFSMESLKTLKTKDGKYVPTSFIVKVYKKNLTDNTKKLIIQLYRYSKWVKNPNELRNNIIRLVSRNNKYFEIAFSTVPIKRDKKLSKKILKRAMEIK